MRLECRRQECLLVRTGYGAELERISPAELSAAVVVDDLPAAAQWILKPTIDPPGRAGDFRDSLRN